MRPAGLLSLLAAWCAQVPSSLPSRSSLFGLWYGTASTPRVEVRATASRQETPTARLSAIFASATTKPTFWSAWRRNPGCSPMASRPRDPWRLMASHRCRTVNW